MTPGDFPDQAGALCDVGRDFGGRGWCRATSGNFSARVASTRFIVTQSGRDKSVLSVDDLMVCDTETGALDPGCQPSAETPLHAQLYAMDRSIGSVLHTHSVTSTVLSRHAGSSVMLEGFEMQKALRGTKTHATAVTVPVFDNDQDMDALAEVVIRTYRDRGPDVPGFLIAGHGLYAWGADVAEARRHVEGFEFLFECLWQEMLAMRS